MARKCMICGGNPEGTDYGYRKPDKYEEWVGLNRIKRLWVWCPDCGFYWQMRDYPLADLEEIYKTGYRSKEFRGESIIGAYKRIRGIRYNENDQRYLWFAFNTKFHATRKVLDIGSGIGVWPALLKDAEYGVACVEENLDSKVFIRDHLEIDCYDSLDDIKDEFDCISIIHVLEHIEDLEGFLAKVKKRLREGGYLFLEVPDSEEFGRLNKDHDEFNSCHLWFFDIPTLAALMKKNGFTPIHASKKRYSKRGLSRVYMLCN
jgi:SAM-dependent methyltransferase